MSKWEKVDSRSGVCYCQQIPNKTCGIYVIYSIDKKILYVGSSINIKNRLISHGCEHYASFSHTFVGKFNGHQELIIKFKSFPCQEIKTVEKYFIKRLHPKMNFVYNDKYSEHCLAKELRQRGFKKYILETA
jgi:excinuclease UvrABC nuclease subunit